MPLYEFRCKSGHMTEAIRAVGTESTPCGCGRQAQRQQFYANAIGGRARPPVSQRMIPMRQFTEATEELGYAQDKRAQETGEQQPDTHLWDIARVRANKLMKAGVKDSLDYRPDYIS